MGLFFKRKEEKLLEFNKKKLQADINNLSNKISDYKKDLGLQIVKEVIDIAKNIEILEIAGSADEKTLLKHKGRLQAFNDLSAYIDNAVAASKQKDKEAPRGTITMARRTSNQAGASL